jgi:hypothetical protein
MFKISPAVRDDYRKLAYKQDAQCEWSIIPLSSLVWEDEHPGGKCTVPEMDEESRISVIQLTAARTALWLHGRVPGELQQLWEEAKAVLPEWPGFKRLTLPDEDREAVRRFREELDACEAELFADADEVSRVVDEFGVVHVEAKFDLTKQKATKPGESGHDV